MSNQVKNNSLLSRLYKVLFRPDLTDSTHQTKHEYVAIIQRGVDAWNRWREQHSDIQPDLSNINLTGVRLSGANLSRTNLQNSILQQTNLKSTNLNEANLKAAVLVSTDFRQADLIFSHLEGANLSRANLAGANLQGAYLNIETRLNDIILSDKESGTAKVSDVNWSEANLAVVDWSSVQMLGDEYVARQDKISNGNRKGKSV